MGARGTGVAERRRLEVEANLVVMVSVNEFESVSQGVGDRCLGSRQDTADQDTGYTKECIYMFSYSSG